MSNQEIEQYTAVPANQNFLRNTVVLEFAQPRGKHKAGICSENKGYIRTKARRMGHILSI